jgi:anthranilate phosphoribosyltransferase
MREILNKLIDHQELDKETARNVLHRLAKGEFNVSQMAAFLTVYLMRTITVEELKGFQEAMLELCVPLNLDDFNPIDLCGTGGDGKDTFNISTLSAFIVAGAGQAVAKHGNNGVSSACGSSNLLAHFGYNFTSDESKIKKQLDEANICFLHAPLFHPAMKNVAPVRRELGVKTFFNMLGPMVNPAQPKNQLVGVFNLQLARLYAYLYQQTNKSFAIVHSLDGYDEISLTSAAKVYKPDSEQMLSPQDFNLPRLEENQLFGGGTIEESAKIFTNILEKRGTEAQQAAVLANSGLALSVAQGCTLEQGVTAARTSLESGAALNSFKKLIAA